MRRAAATGVLDFTHADPRNPHWWRRLRIILNELEHQNLILLQTAQYQRTLAMLAVPDLTDTGRQQLLDSSSQRIDRLIGELFPWYGQAGDRLVDTRTSDERLADLWKHYWGDPNDPAVQANIQATVRAMEAGSVRR